MHPLGQPTSHTILAAAARRARRCLSRACRCCCGRTAAGWTGAGCPPRRPRWCSWRARRVWSHPAPFRAVVDQLVPGLSRSKRPSGDGRARGPRRPARALVPQGPARAPRPRGAPGQSRAVQSLSRSPVYFIGESSYEKTGQHDNDFTAHGHCRRRRACSPRCARAGRCTRCWTRWRCTAAPTSPRTQRFASPGCISVLPPMEMPVK